MEQPVWPELENSTTVGLEEDVVLNSTAATWTDWTKIEVKPSVSAKTVSAIGLVITVLGVVTNFLGTRPRDRLGRPRLLQDDIFCRSTGT